MSKHKQSQTKMLLDWMRKGRSITPLKALNMFGIYRLAARCLELKRSGHNIKSEMVYEYPIKFARYRLIK